jgi:hypothetical protein
LKTCPCESITCRLEEHTCDFGRKQAAQAAPNYSKWFTHKLYKNCDGRKHYSIRVMHKKHEKWGGGHKCAMDAAKENCHCTCHDSFKAGFSALPEAA